MDPRRVVSTRRRHSFNLSYVAGGIATPLCHLLSRLAPSSRDRHDELLIPSQR